MKNLSVTLLIAALAAGCTTGASKTAPATTAATASKAQPPASESDRVPTHEEQVRARKKVEAMASLAGKPLPDEDLTPSAPPEIVVDKKTGLRLEKIPKSNSVYVKDGQVHHRFAASSLGIPLVREDATAYYVEAEPVVKRGTTPGEGSEATDLKPILELPASEGEVVQPKVSARRIRLEERSEGLPKSGFWRANLDVADLDGDGRLEIVTPPPRLTTGGPRIFKAEGNGWKEIRPQITDAGGAHFGYGGVAVADMNGDGKPDIVAIGHMAGMTILFNEGGLRFRAEDRGLPVAMSGRSLAVADLNGDGRLDIVAQSDESEYTKIQFGQLGANPANPPAKPATPAPGTGEYVPGVDTRFFLARPDGTFEERHSGLEESCYGYSIAIDAKPIDGGAPFLVTSCRYSGRTQVLYTWDKPTSSFVRSGMDVVERFGYHIGVATGTYEGKPAAFVSYFKSAPSIAVPQINGYGVSVYYRDGKEWKRKRVVKAVQTPSWDLSAIAVGDLDGDGLDDVVLADDATSRLRIFFQTRDGGFEELAKELEPVTKNRATSLKIADLDGDGRNDIVLMYEFRSSERSREGGVRVFMNRLP